MKGECGKPVGRGMDIPTHSVKTTLEGKPGTNRHLNLPFHSTALQGMKSQSPEGGATDKLASSCASCGT